MGIRGDFSALGGLRAQIKQLATDGARKAVARAIGAEALALVQLGFRNGVDPEGKPWEEITNRTGVLGSRGKPLLDTGRLRSSFSVKLTDQGFRIGTNVVYAEFHQHGTNGRKGGTQRRFMNRRGRFMSQRQVERARARAANAARMLSQFYNSGMSEADVGRAWVRRLQRRTVGPQFKFLNIKAGSGKLPQRMMLPDGKLSATWERAFHEAGGRAFQKLFRRK